MNRFIVLVCVTLTATLVACADEQPQPNTPNELNMKPTTTDGNSLDSSSITTSTTTMIPTSPQEDFNGRNNNNDDNDKDDDNQQQQQFGIDFRPMPFDFFGPPRGPSSPFMNLFGNIFDDMRRQRESLSKQFDELEKEAAEGQSTSYFSRNGVSYVKTCVVKRVDSQQQQKQQTSTQQQIQY